MVPASVRKSEQVLTVSESSRRDLLEEFHVPADKVVVSLEGPGQGFEEVSAFADVKKKYSLPSQYFLAIGTGVHKRVELTAEAVKQVRARGIDTHLVVAGYKDRNFDSLTQDELKQAANFEPYKAPSSTTGMGSTATPTRPAPSGTGVPK